MRSSASGLSLPLTGPCPSCPCSQARVAYLLPTLSPSGRRHSRPASQGGSGCPGNPAVSSPTSLWPRPPSAPTRSRACGLESHRPVGDGGQGVPETQVSALVPTRWPRLPLQSQSPRCALIFLAASGSRQGTLQGSAEGWPWAAPAATGFPPGVRGCPLTPSEGDIQGPDQTLLVPGPRTSTPGSVPVPLGAPHPLPTGAPPACPPWRGMGQGPSCLLLSEDQPSGS